MIAGAASHRADERVIVISWAELAGFSGHAEKKESLHAIIPSPAKFWLLYRKNPRQLRELTRAEVFLP